MPLDPENKLKVFSAAAVVQKTIVADLLKPVREDMHQKAAEEFLIGEFHSVSLAGAVVPGIEGDFGIGNGKDPGIGDGDAVGIAAKVFDSIPEPVKGLFNEGAPVFPVKGVTERKELRRKGKGGTSSGKGESTVPEELFQKGKKLTLELVAKDVDRNKEGIRRFFQLPVSGQTAAGNDAVNVRVVIERLSPGMQDLDNAGSGAKKLRVGGKFQQSLGRSPVEKIVKKLLIAVDQGVQFLRNGKDHMEVRCVDDLRLSGIDPLLFQESLAVGTVAVAAGIVVNINITAFRAGADVAAHFLCFALLNRGSRFHLCPGGRAGGCKRIKSRVKD